MPCFSVYFVCFCFLLDLSLSVRKENIKCASPPECRDGCTDGYRGLYCNRRCPRKCLKCHRYTGHCWSNCHDGHFGKRCSTRCYFCNKCDMHGNCLSEDGTEKATSFTTANSVTSRVTIITRRLKASRNYAGVTQSIIADTASNVIRNDTSQGYPTSMVICIAVAVFIAILICAIRYANTHKKKLTFPESPEEEILSSEPHSANTYDEIEDADLSNHSTNMSTSTNSAAVPLWVNDFDGSSVYIHPSVSQYHDRGIPNQSIYETNTFLNMSTSGDSSRPLMCNGPLRMEELSRSGHDEAVMYIHPVTSQNNDSDPSNKNVFDTETTLSNLSSSISSVSSVTCNGPMRRTHVISAAPDESSNCVQSVVPLNRYLSYNGQLRDAAFKEARAALDAVMKERSAAGLGASTRKRIEVISESEENMLWDKGLLGDNAPQQLLDTILYLTGLHLLLRGGSEHRQLRLLKNPQISGPFVDTCDRSYLLYKENASKSNQGGIKHRKVLPKEVRANDNPSNPTVIFNFH